MHLQFHFSMGVFFFSHLEVNIFRLMKNIDALKTSVIRGLVVGLKGIIHFGMNDESI